MKTSTAVGSRVATKLIFPSCMHVTFTYGCMGRGIYRLFDATIVVSTLKKCHTTREYSNRSPYIGVWYAPGTHELGRPKSGWSFLESKLVNHCKSGVEMGSIDRGLTVHMQIQTVSEICTMTSSKSHLSRSRWKLVPGIYTLEDTRRWSMSVSLPNSRPSTRYNPKTFPIRTLNK